MGHPHIKHVMNMTFDLCPAFCFVHVHVSLNKPVRLLTLVVLQQAKESAIRVRKYENVDSKFHTCLLECLNLVHF